MQESELKVFEIPMNELYCDNEFNCRGSIAPIDVIDIVHSVEQIGLQQPIVAQPFDKVPGKKYRIVSGHRRFTAFRVLERKTIPAIIRLDLDELQARKLNLEENIKRKNLNILQEAKALLPFHKAGWTQKEIAEQLSQPTHWVFVRNALLNLPEDVQQVAEAGLLTQEHIVQLSKMVKKQPEKMYEAVKKIKMAKEAGEKKKIEIVSKPKKAFSKRMRTRAEIFEMMNLLTEYIGTGLHTRIAAWIAGEVTDLDIHKDIKEAADKKGKFYEIPKEFFENIMQCQS